MIEQLSIFLQNEAGKLAAITGCLADGGVNIRALNIADTTDFGILRMLVSDVKKGVELLSDKGYMVKATPVTVVAVPDKPGGLAEVLSVLAAGNFNIEYMYSYLGRSEKNAYMVFRFQENGADAAAFLSENGCRVADKKDLHLL